MPPIEAANPSHLPEILRIEGVSFSDPWSALAFESCMSDPMVLCRVMPGGSGLLGFAVLQIVVPEAELQNIAVDPTLRGRGLGRYLLCGLIEEGREQGVEVFHLEVRASNLAAISLYQSLGFRPVGLRRKYYDNPSEDALRMTLLC